MVSCVNFVCILLFVFYFVVTFILLLLLCLCVPQFLPLSRQYSRSHFYDFYVVILVSCMCRCLKSLFTYQGKVVGKWWGSKLGHVVVYPCVNY